MKHFFARLSNQTLKAALLLVALNFSLSAYSGIPEWKVLIYMQADNDLSEYALKDLAELISTKTDHAPVYVELDLPGDFGVRRVKIENTSDALDIDLINSQTLNYFPEYSQTQKQRLLDFLLWSHSYEPSEHTLLVIWGHGQGYGGEIPNRFGGVAVDQMPASKLSVKDIALILKEHNELTSSRIDILSMDACLMQTLEVLVELVPHTDFVLGSTQIQDFHGLPYDQILKFLNTSANITPLDLAQRIPKIFEEDASLNFDFDQRTISAVSTKNLSSEFIPSFQKAISEIDFYFESHFFELLELKSQIEQIPQIMGDSTDLNTFLSFLEAYFFKIGEFELSEHVSRASINLSSSIVSYYFGDFYFDDELYSFGEFKAFGFWLPRDRENYVDRGVDFSSSALMISTPEWMRLLSRLYPKL